MSFLAPLFLAGAAAVALPILFHLIRRSSRERVLFGSLMFLTPSPPTITRRSRLENILLLLIRCGIICLLAFAFARPYVARSITEPPAPATKKRFLILLDASASMRREKLWDAARQNVLNVVRSMDAGDEFGIYLFDQQFRPLLSMEQGSRLKPSERLSVVSSRLAAAQPGWGSTHLGSALIHGVEQLLDSVNHDTTEQGNSHSRIYLISDLQSGARLDGLQGFEWPRNLDVTIIPAVASEFSNAALQPLRENRRLFENAAKAPVRIRAQNGPNSQLDQFQLQWQHNGKPASKAVSLYVPAGQSKITHAPPKPDGADALVLMGDKVDFDNTIWNVDLPIQHATVFYLGDEPADNPNEPLYYVKRAFEQTNLAIHVISGNFAQVPVESAGLVILGANADQDKLALAQKALEAAKTVIFPLHDAGDGHRLQTLLRKPVEVSEATVANYALFGQIDFSQPLLAPFADARFSDFTKIHFWKYRHVDLSSFTNAQVLAKFDSGDPALALIPAGKGRILLFASSWSPRDSQLALSSKFVPLMFTTLEHSVHAPSLVLQYLVGDVVSLAGFKQSTSKASASAQPDLVILPNGEKQPTQGGLFAETQLPGIYQFGEVRFAVNLDPAESKIDPLPLDEFRELGVPLAGNSPVQTAAAIQRQRHLLATEMEGRQKLWRGFIIAAIGFLLFETWLSNRLSRRTLSPA
jgi:hypothetical protein